MSGETNLHVLIKNIKPIINEGEYVFCSVQTLDGISIDIVECMIREKEGITIVLSRDVADEMGLAYDFIAKWITLQVHSALSAVGLTAAFSNALADNNISCNVIAGYYHDHIFVNYIDADKTVEVLKRLSLADNDSN